jgi:hypothetical protein
MMTPIPEFAGVDNTFKELWSLAEEYWTKLWAARKECPPMAVRAWEIGQLTQSLYTAAMCQALRTELGEIREQMDRIEEMLEALGGSK